MGSILRTLGLVCVLMGTAMSSETDQYLALDHHPIDASETLNTRIGHKIQEALYEVNDRKNGQRISCKRLTGKILWKFRFFLMHRIELWAQRGNVDVFPSLEVSNGAYMDSSIHSNGKKFNTKKIVPLARTIRVNGVNFGTDKLGHFVSMGHKYFKRYLRHIEEGLSEEEAINQIIQYGIATEKGMIGEKVSGVRSYADLEANYQGLLFAKSLCHDKNPRLALERGKWKIVRPIDISAYINPNFDESFNNSTFSLKKWEMVKENLQKHCDKLGSNGKPIRLKTYSDFENSKNMKLIYEAEKRGELPPQEQFSLKAACLFN